MHRSIRVTLTLWYVGLLAIILTLFSSILYLKVAQGMLEDVDRLLLSQARGVADTIEAFWKAEQAAANTPGNWQDAPSYTLREEVRRDRFSTMVTRWATTTNSLDAGVLVRLLDRRGHVLAASIGGTRWGLWEAAERPSMVPAGPPFYRTVGQAEGGVRIITHPIIEAGEVLYGIQVAASLHDRYVSLRHLQWLLCWLIPLTLVLTSAVGWFLASTALRPIGRMIAQAQHISAARLDQRLDVPRTHDEVEQLGVTFNAMLARLERTFRRLRQFSAAASHELRTPLTVMKGELEVALRRPREPEEYQRVLRTQLEALNEMARIVQELLSVARRDTDEVALEWERVELGALTRHVTTMLRPVAEEHQVRLDLACPTALEIRGEPGLLERLLANLLENAIRHTPPGGRVILQAEAMDALARVIVQDTGCGIPPAQLPTIFDRFFTRQTAQEARASTGLGLGLCRWIAEAHQGRIEVESAPGQGATFTLWLPLISSSVVEPSFAGS